jgi:hypothetical protein
VAPASCPTVTISRRFGCEGFPLAEQIKSVFEARTGEVWTIYDKALLDLVSEHEQLAPKLFADLGGPSRSVDALGFLVAGYVPHSQLFKRIPKHIVRIAEAGHAIIVGRGGAIVTQKLSNCYHFRLEGSLEFRVASVARRLALPEAEARKLVRENERARDAFIDVDQLVLADEHHVAVVQVMAAHAVGFHEDAVGAVQILDDARVLRRDDLAVVATDEAAVDVQVVVGRAADDHPALTQRDLLHRATVGGYQEPPERGPPIRRARRPRRQALGFRGVVARTVGEVEPLQLAHRADNVGVRHEIGRAHV